jgi:hypothetical protein
MRRVYAGPNAPSRSRIKCAGRFVPRKGFGYLPRDPLSDRIGSDTDCGKPSASVMENHQAAEELERDRPHDEQVDGRDALCVITEKRLPALRGWSPGPVHVHGHRRLSDLDAEHQ